MFDLVSKQRVLRKGDKVFGKFFGKLTPLTQNWPRQHDSIAPEGGVSTSGWGAAAISGCGWAKPQVESHSRIPRECALHMYDHTVIHVAP